MKIDLTKMFKNTKGATVPDEHGVPLTLGSVIFAGLNYTSIVLEADPQQRTPIARKMQRGRLLQRLIPATDSIELKVEDVAEIKVCVGLMPHMTPWLLVQFDDLIDPTGETTKEPKS